MRHKSKIFIGIIFLSGFIVGALKPIDWIYWKIAEYEIPNIKKKSLAEESPFSKIPRNEWLIESKKAFVIECDDKRAPYHFLVIPKAQIKNITEADSQNCNRNV